MCAPPPRPRFPSPLPFSQTVPFDGLAHQLEIIRPSCSLVSLNAASPGERGRALKAELHPAPPLAIPAGGGRLASPHLITVRLFVEDHAETSSLSQITDDFTCLQHNVI